MRYFEGRTPLDPTRKRLAYSPHAPPAQVVVLPQAGHRDAKTSIVATRSVTPPRLAARRTETRLVRKRKPPTVLAPAVPVPATRPTTHPVAKIPSAATRSARATPSAVRPVGTGNACQSPIHGVAARSHRRADGLYRRRGRPLIATVSSGVTTGGCSCILGRRRRTRVNSRPVLRGRSGAVPLGVH